MAIKEDGYLATDTSEDLDLDLNMDDVDGGDDSTSSSKSPWGGKKVKIAALLVVVMAVEAMAIYFVLPQPAASVSAGEDDTALGENPDGEDVNHDVDTVEVEIGRFDTTNSRADSSAVIHISFKLVAIVASDQKDKFNLAAKSKHKARVRQAVITVCRSSSLNDLSDPELGVIKRKIRETVNKILRKSYIIEVVIDGFTTMEQ